MEKITISQGDSHLDARKNINNDLLIKIEEYFNDDDDDGEWYVADICLNKENAIKLKNFIELFLAD